jgi:hypothetical protein
MLTPSYPSDFSTTVRSSTPHRRRMPRPAITLLGLALSMTSISSAFAAEPATIAPVISLATGTYSGTQTVTITDSTPGAVIYYAINTAVKTTSTVYSGPITVSSNSILNTEAEAGGYQVSSKVTATYSFIATPPVISPAAGTYYTDKTVALTTSTPESNIYYTTKGTTPTTSSFFYNGPFNVTANTQVQAITISKEFNTSPVSTASYTIELPAPAPTFSLASGTYSKVETVSISCGNKSAAIYYTTNGTTPTTKSAVYSAPLSVGVNEKISAIALAAGGSNSPLATATYTITLPAAAPIFSPLGGKFTSVPNIVLSSTTSGAAIYYTTDGSTPTSASTPYTGPISVGVTETIHALALANGGSVSPVTKQEYQITLPTAVPVISPPSGTYSSFQTVTISDATPGAVIHYTVNGSYPTTTSPVYSGSITAPTGTSIQAMAAVPTYSPSAVVTAQYTVIAAPPSISPAEGTFNYKATVSMSTRVPGGVIHYTSDGSTPTATSAVYAGPIALAPNATTTETYQAITVAPGFVTSSMTGTSFTITMPDGILANAIVSTTPQLTIPPNFMGLSTDFRQPTLMMGQASTGVNTIFRTLVKNLTQYLTAPLLLRIAVDNTTAAQLQPDVEPLAEFAQAVNVHYTLGVDLMNNNVDDSAAQATQWVNGIPNDVIDAIEIGNEPDNYPYQGVRPSTYGFTDYLAQFQEWQQAVQAATGGQIGVMAAATAGSAWRADAESTLSNQTFSPVLVSQHAYCGGPAPGQTLPPDYLLESINVTKLPAAYAGYAAVAHQQGLIFRMGEINSVGGGGATGISNTFQSTLWAVDVMFNYLNNGMDGVNWHSGEYTPYALYEFKPQPKNGMTVFNLVSINPVYYGLYTFAQLAGRGAKLLPVANMTDSNVSIWATVDNTSTAHVVVINKDEQATGNVQITLPGYSTGTVRYLKAPSYSSTNGVTLGGQTFDGTPDGTIQGTLVTSTITAENGVFTLPTMPTVTAAIIDFAPETTGRVIAHPTLGPIKGRPGN